MNQSVRPDHIRPIVSELLLGNFHRLAFPALPLLCGFKFKAFSEVHECLFVAYHSQISLELVEAGADGLEVFEWGQRGEGFYLVVAVA